MSRKNVRDRLRDGDITAGDAIAVYGLTLAHAWAILNNCEAAYLTAMYSTPEEN
jgi:hypothetical protein